MELYQPFKYLDFKNSRCFLCGKELDFEIDFISIFPTWFMKEFGLFGKPFKLLNESHKNYEDLLIPCCKACQINYLNPLEDKVKLAFQGGYENMKALEAWKLFLWVSKIIYGIIFLEIQIALEDYSKEESIKDEIKEPLGISPSLLTKFSNVHLFLQSLRLDLDLEDFTPFSCWIIPLSPTDIQNPFEYRDDMSTLIFSITTANFGFILCLQDNEMNLNYHQAFFQNWVSIPLTFRQFQEFRAKVFYSAYLFNSVPSYMILPPVIHKKEFTIIANPLLSGSGALFKPWDNKTYAQVLEAFWKPWGTSKLEILKDEDHPLSVF